MPRGEPSWQTSSTSPMSMPSSSEAVATSSLSLPCFRRCSASKRCSFARLPWCAAIASAPSLSARWRAARSAIRRVLTNTSVVRCAAASSAMRS
ncbi:aTP-dependent helicase, DEAD/DEAH family [Burkholderia pseudomallei MSHR435]|nr:aTP-dependent helicase, DEAD/DEAH family [Burkholderia pseudomallei MSHR435]